MKLLTSNLLFQVCGTDLQQRITNSDILCGDYVCDDGKREFKHPVYGRFVELFGYRCNSTVDCVNTDLDESGCSAEQVTLPSGKQITANLVCNDRYRIYM